MISSWQVTMNDEVQVLKQIDDLREQHRLLDEEIRSGEVDEFSLAQKKKRKLQLRDMIQTLECEVYPDQPA